MPLFDTYRTCFSIEIAKGRRKSKLENSFCVQFSCPVFFVSHYSIMIMISSLRDLKLKSVAMNIFIYRILQLQLLCFSFVASLCTATKKFFCVAYSQGAWHDKNIEDFILDAHLVGIGFLYTKAQVWFLLAGIFKAVCTIKA